MHFAPVFPAIGSPSNHFLDTPVFSPSHYVFCGCIQLIQSSGDISLISIPAKSSLNLLRPAIFLIEPITTKELANAGVVWLFLWRFERDKAIEVLVDWSWIAGAAVGGLWRTVPVDIMLIANVPKEPYLALRHEHSYTQRMDRGISESLVVEASSSIQPIKVSFIRFASEEIQVPNLEI